MANDFSAMDSNAERKRPQARAPACGLRGEPASRASAGDRARGGLSEKLAYRYFWRQNVVDFLRSKKM